jgi:hypothetical protein
MQTAFSVCGSMHFTQLPTSLVVETRHKLTSHEVAKATAAASGIGGGQTHPPGVCVLPER